MPHIQQERHNREAAAAASASERQQPANDERGDVRGGHEARHPDASAGVVADGVRRLHVHRRIGLHPAAAHRFQLLRARAVAGGGERAEAVGMGEVGAGIPLQLHGRG